MKILVIGGKGLIGTKLVNQLKKLGHEVTSASRSSGVDTVTGNGLESALKNIDVVVDVANSPSFEDKAVMEFFEKSGFNIAAAEKAANIKHHIALSVVGTDRLSESGYFRAKIAQENSIRASGIPYTIVRATQFFEFLNYLAESSTNGEKVTISSAFMQPMAANDVAELLAEIVEEKPLNNIIEIAGPERIRLSDMIQTYLHAIKDPRRVVADSHTPYSGAILEEETLVPEFTPRLGKMTFNEWFESQSKL